MIIQLIWFKVSNEARMKAQSFIELQYAWVQEVEDLREIGKISYLDNALIVEVVSKKLPSRESRQHYLERRISIQNGGKTEFEILTIFMETERALQRAVGTMEGGLCAKR